MDGNIQLFYTKMDELFIRPKRSCEIHNWVQYCEFSMEERLHGNHADTKLVAFDAVLEMTMSRNLGFMKAGGDVDEIGRAHV